MRQVNKRPLFVLLDATWPEVHKMFRSRLNDYFCTSKVTALCLDLAGKPLATQALETCLDVFTHQFLWVLAGPSKLSALLL